MVGSAFRGQEWREQVLEAAIREQGLADRVRMLPFREDIRDVLAGCDVFVLPSTRPDPFPNTVLEAMASGLPVVASAAGGVREMIEDGVSGRLVQPNNPQAFCEAWRELAADPGRRRALGQAAAERAAREFSVEKHDAAMRELFASIRPSASPDRGRA
jgi:glycosyltransferase involved in cell wall biosynthesis